MRVCICICVHKLCIDNMCVYVHIFICMRVYAYVIFGWKLVFRWFDSKQVNTGLCPSHLHLQLVKNVLCHLSPSYSRCVSVFVHREEEEEEGEEGGEEEGVRWGLSGRRTSEREGRDLSERPLVRFSKLGCARSTEYARAPRGHQRQSRAALTML